MGLNYTYIVLIPNKNTPSSFNEYHPISLCNVTYKIISKVVANRLKPLIPLLISPEQSGYVEGHQILNGIILAHEITHSLKNSKTPGMLLKLNFSKDFDKLSWDFIERTLLAFGFCRA